MKKYLLIILLAINAVSFAQKDTMDFKKISRQIDSSMKQLDSINERINKSYSGMDSAYMQRQIEQNNKNLDAFMAMQREREAKQKRSNWIRLGIGVLFLGVLIFGLMRRRKKIA